MKLQNIIWSQKKIWIKTIDSRQQTKLRLFWKCSEFELKVRIQNQLLFFWKKKQFVSTSYASPLTLSGRQGSYMTPDSKMVFLIDFRLFPSFSMVLNCTDERTTCSNDIFVIFSVIVDEYLVHSHWIGLMENGITSNSGSAGDTSHGAYNITLGAEG